MPKAGFLSISPFSIFEFMDLKRLFLMYDKIIIETESLKIARMAKDPIPAGEIPSWLNSKTPGQLPLYGDILGLAGDDLFVENLRNIDYLKAIDFIEFLDYNQLTHNSTKIPLKYEGIIEELDHDFKETSDPLDYFEKTPDAKARIMSLMLEDIEDYRTIPLLRRPPQPLNSTKEAQVVNILMGHLPQPDDSVSWEQLIDFKNDPVTLESYYNLGDWINETCRKEYNRHEIIDKMNHLLHQYEHQYKIHKLKYKTGLLEMVVTATLDVIAGNFGQAIHTTLFSLSRAHANLLDAESKFAGREVAYIYKAKQKW